MFVLASHQFTWAAQANFSWLANNASDGTVGYMLHYGTSSREYTEFIDVGSPNPVNGRVNASVFQLVPDQTYFFTVTAYNVNGEQSSYPNEVSCTIPSESSSSSSSSSLYELYISTSSNLSNADVLEGVTADGDVYVFTGPDAGISNVTFSVDGVYTQTEYYTPFELAGGAAFDMSKLSLGQHKITANIKLTDGSNKLISSVFTVSSAADSADNKISVGTNSYDLFVTTSPSLSGAVTLDGSTVEGDIYVFTGPDTDVAHVTFAVDGAVAQKENFAPFELAGGAAFNTSSLSPGQHNITADIQLNDGSTAIVTSSFTIPSEKDQSDNDGLHDIYVSTSPNLSGASILDGATAEGDIYVFTGPDTGVSSVTFSIDGLVAQTESSAPFELAGESAFNTSQLSPGRHEITANIEMSDGSIELVSAIFTIPSADSLYDILVSESRYLSGATGLEGTEVDGDIYVFTSPDDGISRVIFSIDGVVSQTEVSAPFELAGGAAFNTSQLSSGTHQISASIELQDGSAEMIGASFFVK
jgi:hypothetical protein